MKINTKNQEKVIQALEENNGKLESYVEYRDIESAIKRFDKSVFDNTHGIKKHSNGSKIVINGFSGTLPSAYNYGKEYAFVVVEKFSSGWFLVECARGTAYSGQEVHKNTMSLTEKAKNILAKKLLSETLNY